MAERTLFVVAPDSPVMSVVKVHREREETFRKAVAVFLEACGATSKYYAGDGRLRGLIFPKGAELPEGWRFAQQGALPDKRTKAGKEAARQMEDLPRGYDPLDFCDDMNTRFKEHYETIDGGYFQWSQFFDLCGETLLSTPSVLKLHPPGCRELKMSEYYTMVEIAEAWKQSADIGKGASNELESLGV